MLNYTTNLIFCQENYDPAVNSVLVVVLGILTLTLEPVALNDCTEDDIVPFTLSSIPGPGK